MVYEWKFESKYPVSAQVAGETMEQIRLASGKGYLEAEDLLEESRADSAPLHPCFEWNDDIAAEKYRLAQARDMIKNITVKVIDEKPLTEPQRAFVTVVPNTAKGKFVPLQIALETPEYRAQVLQNARWELQNFKRKYNAYSELSKVFEAIDDFADSLT
ncbi:MAG: hypothetical protein IJT73_00710 [Selenomonadaceae bacterium]|nr:hypothetical protein [Selenomonadaceae bacterium]